MAEPGLPESVLAEPVMADDERPSASISIGRSACRNVPYCDFNSHVRREPIDEQRFLRAFHTEIGATAERVRGRTVSTIFFGGGTPSLMQPATDRGACSIPSPGSGASRRTPKSRSKPIPTSVEATRFRGYRAAGVNRVSLGVQALDDRVLAELGRMHSAREALDAVAIARSVFERYSFDLIYARPNQEPRAWASELKGALAEAGDHLSLYQLTIEPETPFSALHAAGKLRLPDEDTSRALYDTTQEICAAAGLPAYEISNHARPGGECRHNLVYWRAQEYAGIGPGAPWPARYRRRAACDRDRKGAGKLADAGRGQGHGLVTDDVLTREERSDEFLLMGLRLAEGIDIDSLHQNIRPAARSGPHRHAARAWSGRNHRRGTPARDLTGLSGPRCGGCRSRGVTVHARRISSDSTP